MNVGSILNDDVPAGQGSGNTRSPAKTGSGSPEEPLKRPQSIQQRHSIVNLLNDPTPARSPGPGPANGPQKTVEDSRRGSSDVGEADSSMDLGTSESHYTSRNGPGNPQSFHDDDSLDADVDTEGLKFDSDEHQPVLNPEMVQVGKKASGDLWKPRRYDEPPVWAREYNSGRNNGGPAPEPMPTFDNGAQSTVLTSKPVFDRKHALGVDLECSVTGVIPPASVVRTIAQWIYANFVEIPDENRKHIELELKFGTIMDKRAGHRIDINVSTECVYTNTSNTYFDMGVHEVGWKEMCLFLDELETAYQDELKRNPSATKAKRKFSTLETDVTDTFYQVSNRNEQPKSIRISRDNALNPPRYVGINKQRLSDLYIHNPSSMYDLRLSLSYENPLPDSSVEPIVKRQQPSLTRVKKRNSWSHRPTVTTFDLTRVFMPRELKNKAGKTVVEQEQSYEAELEVDTGELFAGFDKVKNGSDNVRFEELVEIFLNNARCLNNRVTKLANK